MRAGKEKKKKKDNSRYWDILFGLFKNVNVMKNQTVKRTFSITGN